MKKREKFDRKNISVILKLLQVLPNAIAYLFKTVRASDVSEREEIVIIYMIEFLLQ